jgi:hypothetical protein
MIEWMDLMWSGKPVFVEVSDVDLRQRRFKAVFMVNELSRDNRRVFSQRQLSRQGRDKIDQYIARSGGDYELSHTSMLLLRQSIFPDLPDKIFNILQEDFR